ncbi:MAG: M81 family metallopeptidase [Caldilineaceae bacterium]
MDAVLLSTCTAPCVSEACIDCEGDTVACIRALSGRTSPSAWNWTLHCHLTELLIDNADAVITATRSPHRCALAAEELLRHHRRHRRKVKPHIAMHDLNMIGVYHTTREPVKSFVQTTTDLQDACSPVSLGHGFPWGDVADMARSLVITDDSEKGRCAGQGSGDRILRHARPVQLRAISPSTRRWTAAASAEKPVVLADVSDNAWRRFNDSTFILRRAAGTQHGQRGHRLYLGSNCGGKRPWRSARA